MARDARGGPPRFGAKAQKAGRRPRPARGDAASHGRMTRAGSSGGEVERAPVRAVDAPGREPAAVDRDVRDAMHQAIALILVSATVLLIIGIVMVYSATAPSAIRYAHANGLPTAFNTANGQLMYAAIGVVLTAAAAFVPLRLYERMADAVFVCGILLQLAVLSPLGSAVAGNTNWISLGPIRVQPSEFLKLATILWLAARLGGMRRDDWRISSFLLPTWWPWPAHLRGRYTMPVGTGAIAALAAVLAGFDMGTAMVFALICAGIFWLAGMPRRYFMWIGGLGVFGAAVLVAVNPSRLTRIKEYLDTLLSQPDALNPTQADFALWAFGSGGLSGGGLGTGIEKWPGNLAEAQNDFIFAVIGEELGMFGCLVVVAMFIVLGWGLVRICLAHPSRFASLACGGIAVWMCGQAIANMLVVTGVLPVFGVPLPLVSQGGSAVVACLLAVGFAVACAMDAPGVRASFRVPRRLAYRARAVVKG